MFSIVPGNYEALNKRVSLSLSLEKGDTEGNGQIFNLLMRGPKSKRLPIPPSAVSCDIALCREMLGGQQSPSLSTEETEKGRFSQVTMKLPLCVSHWGLWSRSLRWHLRTAVRPLKSLTCDNESRSHATCSWEHQARKKRRQADCHQAG